MFAQKFQEDSEKKYQKKLKQYGESWKTMSIRRLQERLKEEYEEWEFNKDKHWKIVYDELIDIRNLASMLAERTKPHTSDNNDFKKPCPQCNGGKKEFIDMHPPWIEHPCAMCGGQGFIKS